MVIAMRLIREAVVVRNSAKLLKLFQHIPMQTDDLLHPQANT